VWDRKVRGMETVLKALREYVKENGYVPSVRELCKLTGYKSTSTIHRMLHNLETAGLIEIKKGCFRCIKIL